MGLAAASLWDAMRFILEYWKSCLVLLQDLSQVFFNGLRNLQNSELDGSLLMFFPFEKGQERASCQSLVDSHIMFRSI